jgi:sulfide:quinone oxidoreductase
MRVLIAGGGVAGVEALLALSALAEDLVELQLLSPYEEFVYRPLQVVEPFGSGESIAFDLRQIVEDAGARHTRDALARVDPEARTITTASGATHDYEALLIALGARQVEAVPGALTFGDRRQRARFADLLAALGRRGTSRLAFVVPREANWSIAAYELALLTAAERDARRLSGVEITLVTHEPAPLDLFGRAASDLLAGRLEEAGISLRVSSVAERFDRGKLSVVGGESLAVDGVVALPALEVPRLPGLPQVQGGFVQTGVRMEVAGLEDVWAAGDATSFPIKQGGLATQQSDVAARSIAARAGADVPVEPFQPVLRGVLITGEAPDFLRSRPRDPAGGVASRGAALWSPGMKVAGKYLAPYLAGALRQRGSGELVDVEAPEDLEGERAAHSRAVELVLAAADADARLGHFEDAIKWLSLVEEFSLVIPPEYVARRYEWRRQLDPDAPPDPAAKRIDPSFGSPAEAISDLQRRLGWLREMERRNEGEMRANLAVLDEGISELKALSRRTGILEARAGPGARGRSSEDR